MTKEEKHDKKCLCDECTGIAQYERNEAAYIQAWNREYLQ